MKTKKCFPIPVHTFLLALLILCFGCKEDDAPLLTTSDATDIGITTTLIGGHVTSDGGASVVARGVCWSLFEMPTTSDNKTSDGAGTGSFESNMTGLTANETYFVRAYATNSVGTGYGNEVTLTTYRVKDIDGNGYHSVIIGAQEWMKENLKTTKYSDGSAIQNAVEDAAWLNRSTGAYCDFNNTPSNANVYGRLYNWYAVVDIHNVCPSGWHVPSLSEADVLINALGGETIAGGKMKSTGTLQNGNGLWNEPNTGGTNDSGFTGLPAGTRFDAADFRDLNNFAHWRTTDGWSLRLRNNHTMVEKFFNYATNGTAVRCVKD
jgi:uncharacterized protein (TIGR02145 family)